MIDVFVRKADIRTLFFKLSHFKTYVPNFDLLVATGFFNITVKNKPRDFIIPSNVVKFTVVVFCLFVYVLPGWHR